MPSCAGRRCLGYLGDGRLEISNNAAERGMPAASLYTILETAKMNEVNPQAYLTDVLARLADHPINQIDALLPWHQKA